MATRPRPLASVRNGSARVHRLVGDLTLTHVDELADDADRTCGRVRVSLNPGLAGGDHVDLGGVARQRVREEQRREVLGGVEGEGLERGFSVTLVGLSEWLKAWKVESTASE